MTTSKPPRLVAARRRLLQNPYAHLNGEGGFDGPEWGVSAGRGASSSQVSNSRLRYQNPYAHLGDADIDEPDRVGANIKVPDSLDVRDPYAEIAQAARDLQLRIWENRHRLWPEGVPVDPVELLDPERAAGLIGYGFKDAEFLGEQVAGVIDYPARCIKVSHRFSPQVRRFTGAHELGHAVLHRENRMHRDRPVDGSGSRREAKEIEADKFATCFLMPEKLVRDYFLQIFGTIPFVLNEDTAFALDPRDPSDLIRCCETRRDLSKLLAKAEYFNGKHVNSMATRFHVSVETMAIRLEELELV